MERTAKKEARRVRKTAQRYCDNDSKRDMENTRFNRVGESLIEEIDR